MTALKNYAAELTGTFVLVLLGTGSIVISQEYQIIHGLGIALAFGFSVAAMILLFGKISGAHLNPAVTLALAVGKRFPRKHFLPYVISQCMGALLASLLLHRVFPLNTNLGTTLPSCSPVACFLLELFLTFLLMTVILYCSDRTNRVALMNATLIGSVIFLEAWIAGPLTGASMNPARSLSPAIISGHMNYLPIYILAPCSGSLLAVFTISRPREAT